MTRVIWGLMSTKLTHTHPHCKRQLLFTHLTPERVVLGCGAVALSQAALTGARPAARALSASTTRPMLLSVASDSS